MTREERMQVLAGSIYRLNGLEKEVKAEREELRKEFFRLAEYEFKKAPHLLPVRTVEVPEEFWTRTGMTKEEFVQSRFPGWNVEHIERNISTGRDVFIFKKDPKYMGTLVDIEDPEDYPGTIRVRKEISEYSPAVDWDTLRKERPDLFDSLAQETVIYNLNEKALGELILSDPEVVSVLQRHMIVKEPSLKITARKVKDE